MNKTWLIIKREYITRVRNKTFIISTFLTPLFFVGLITAVIYMTPTDKPLPGNINETDIVKEKIEKK
jgi:ABC-type Na+ efflux pump permease subunit